MPNFGYEIKGENEVGAFIDRMRASKFTITEDGVASSITVYIKNGNVAVASKCAIYADDAGDPTSLVGETQELTIAAYFDDWKTYNFVDGPNLTADTPYWLVCWHDGSGDLGQPTRFYRDAGDPNQYFDAAHIYDAWPDPMTNESFNDWKLSIYCTYSVAAPPGLPAPMKTTLTLTL